MVTVSQTFPVSDGLDTFGEQWSSVLFFTLDLPDLFLTCSLGLRVFVGRIPEVKCPVSSLRTQGALLNTINLTYHCWRRPWSPGSGCVVKYLLGCICVILILANFDFDFVWFWFSVCYRAVGGGKFFQQCCLHGRIRSCGLFARVLWIAERNALNVILALLLNSSFAVLAHVSWALVSDWRKHSLQRFFGGNDLERKENTKAVQLCFCTMVQSFKNQRGTVNTALGGKSWDLGFTVSSDSSNSRI